MHETEQKTFLRESECFRRPCPKKTTHFLLFVPVDMEHITTESPPLPVEPHARILAPESTYVEQILEMTKISPSRQMNAPRSIKRADFYIQEAPTFSRDRNR